MVSVFKCCNTAYARTNANTSANTHDVHTHAARCALLHPLWPLYAFLCDTRMYENKQTSLYGPPELFMLQ